MVSFIESVKEPHRQRGTGVEGSVLEIGDMLVSLSAGACMQLFQNLFRMSQDDSCILAQF